MHTEAYLNGRVNPGELTAYEEQFLACTACVERLDSMSVSFTA